MRICESAMSQSKPDYVAVATERELILMGPLLYCIENSVALIDKRCEELIGRSLQSQRRETSVGMYSHEGCVFEGGGKLDTAEAYVKRVDASRRLRK